MPSSWHEANFLVIPILAVAVLSPDSFGEKTAVTELSGDFKGSFGKRPWPGKVQVHRFTDTERSNPDANLRETVNRCDEDKDEDDEDKDKEEWETTSYKELPKRVRRNLPDEFGQPVKVEKGKLRKDLEGFRVKWRSKGRDIWVFYGEKGNVLARGQEPVAGNKPPPVDPGKIVSFKQHVLPLLQERCFRCHGVKKQKGDLNLEKSFAAVLKIVKPGDPRRSLLIQALHGQKTDIMPPKKPLPQAEIDLFRKWVEAGAKND